MLEPRKNKTDISRPFMFFLKGVSIVNRRACMRNDRDRAIGRQDIDRYIYKMLFIDAKVEKMYEPRGNTIEIS